MSFGLGQPGSGCARRLSRGALVSFVSLGCCIPGLFAAIVAMWSGCANGTNDIAVLDASFFASDAPTNVSDGSDDAPALDAHLPTTDSAPAVTDAQAAGDDAQTTSDAVADGGATGDADADAACPGVKILCGSKCVDPTTDPVNCGGCDNTCTSGVCGTVLAATMSTQPPDWTFNGSALWDPDAGSARMTTANTTGVAGTVIYNDPIVTNSFEASFQFRMGFGGGGRFDGMGFMIETDGVTALGSQGGGLGMEGLDGIGVELDIYNNKNCGDVSDDHVGVDMLSNCSSGQPTNLTSVDLTSSIDLDDAAWHTAFVQLAGSSISVAIDGTSTISNLQLGSTSGFLSGAKYYYGFAGGIGGNGSNGAQTEVRNVTVTFPSPQCL